MSRRLKKYMFGKLEYRAMDTVRSAQKILKQIHSLLDDLGVSLKERQLPSDALTGQAALQFIIRWQEGDSEWSAYIQKPSTKQEGLANNLAAIHLWLDGRCLNIRRGIELPAEAFGAHLVDGSNVPASWGDHMLGLRLKMKEVFMETREIVAFVKEITEEAEKYRPAINNVVDVALSFGPEMKKLLDGICDGIVKSKTRMIHKFEDEGFSREEAITITINTLQSMNNIKDNINSIRE